MLGLTSKGISQWVQTDGPYGGFIWDLKADRNNLYARDQFANAVLQSTDKGKSWKPNTNLYWSSYRINDTLLFFITSQGLEESIDNGITWTKNSLQIKNILSIISKGSLIFTNTRDSGIYRSSNQGTSWKRLKSSIIGNSVAYVVSVIDTILIATTRYDQYTKSLANIFRSLDDGET